MFGREQKEILTDPPANRPAAGRPYKKNRVRMDAIFQRLWSGKRDSNPRLRPWQGRTLPLSYSRPASARPLQEHGPTAVCEEVMVPQPRKRRQGEDSVVRRPLSPGSVVRSPLGPWSVNGQRIRRITDDGLSRRRKRSRTPRSRASDRRASPSRRRTGTADRRCARGPGSRRPSW